MRGQIRVHVLTSLKIEHSSFKFELIHDFKENIQYAKQEYSIQDTEEMDGFMKDLLLKTFKFYIVANLPIKIK